MSAERLARARRIVELRERAVQAAQQALAEAVQAHADATAAAAHARGQWESVAGELAALEHPQAGELLERHEHLDRLRDAWQHLERAQARLAEIVEERRRSVTMARASQRKIELWRDKLSEQMAADRQRLERVEADAVAARTAEKSR